MTDERDNRGDVALWKNESDNERAPNAKGTVVAHRTIQEGETVEISLWRNSSENPRAPMMKGKISDKREAQGGGQSQQPSGGNSGGGDEFDPDIPF